MSDVDLGTFSCAACNRQYPWKPAYAGRKVKCKCGQVLTAPAQPPQPAEEDPLANLYDLAEQEQQAARTGATVETGLRCPACQSDMLPGETVCPSCMFNLKTGLKERAQRATTATAGGSAGAASPMLGYAGMSRRPAAQVKADNANALGGSEMKELYIPAALVLVGFAVTLLQYGYAGGAWRGVTYALPAVALSVFFNVVLTFIGCMIVARLIDLGFGAPGPAVLKLVAICLLAPAIAAVVASVVGSDSAVVRMMVPAIVLFPISAFLFVYLFDLALDEALYTSVVIYLVSQWAVMLLLASLIAGIVTPFGTSTAGGNNPTAAIVRADKSAAEMVDRPNATEARTWVRESANRMFDGETHDSSIKLVEDLYAAGARKCTVLSASGAGYALIVDLPSGSEVRKKIFAVINQHETAQDVAVSEQTLDEHQRYHTFQFSLAF